MGAKTGPKPKLGAADSARIRVMIEQGVSDTQIAQAFGVSRATINRLRHYLADSQPEPVSELDAMIRHAREDPASECAECMADKERSRAEMESAGYPLACPGAGIVNGNCTACGKPACAFHTKTS